MKNKRRMHKVWQNRLRYKLMTEAFNEKYKCFRCGVKQNLVIHHLVYVHTEEDYYNPKYYRILCTKCHGYAHGKLKQ